MTSLQRIYQTQFIYLLSVFVMGVLIPYIRGHLLLGLLFIAAAIVQLVYAIRVMNKVVKALSDDISDFRDLQMRLATVAVVFTSFYFWFGVLDSTNTFFEGLHFATTTNVHSIYSIDGFMDNVRDVIDTLVNSAFYSIAIMTTLGDSKIIPVHPMSRVFVGTETALVFFTLVLKLNQFIQAITGQQPQKVITDIDTKQMDIFDESVTG